MLSNRTRPFYPSLAVLIGAILWGVMSVVFFRWAALEDKGWDALAWHAVERDVRTGLRRRDREELAPR